MAEYKKTLKVAWDFSKEQLSKFMTDTNKEITKGLKTGLQSITDPIVSAIKGAFTDSIAEMKSMLEYSQLSSAYTRELAFGYGFSSSEAYAWDKALKLVGLESEEDLYYANTQELAQFREAFERYSNYYTDLYDSGFFEDMQEYQFEMGNFKEEMQMNIIQFFMNNKDLIKQGFKGMMKAAEVLLKMFAWLVSLTGDTQTANASDIISSYSTVTSSSTNVAINNTFNGVSENNRDTLTQAGNMTYAQVIEALTGGNK